MNDANQDHWLDRPANVKRLWRGFLAVLVLTVAAEGLVHLAHVELSGDEDLLACPSARALKLAMFACVIEEANDLDRANVFWSQAYSALNDDEAAKRGGIRGVAPIQPFGDGVSPIGAIM